MIIKCIFLIWSFCCIQNLNAAPYQADSLRVNDLKQEGIQCLTRGDADAALELFTRALSFANRLDLSHEATNLKNNIGVALQEKGEPDSALVWHLEALEEAVRQSDTLIIASSSNNIGIIHYKTGRQAKAMRYFRYSAGLKEILGDAEGLKKSLNNMAAIHLENFDYDSALALYQKVLDMEGGDDSGTAKLAVTLNNMGQLFLLQGKFDEARKYFLRALEHADNLENTRVEAAVYDNLGMLSHKEEKFKKAEEYYQKALGISRRAGDREIERSLALHLSDLYEDTRKYGKALEYYKLYESLAYKLSEESRRVIEKEALFIRQKKENEILRLEKERETQKLQFSILISLLVLFVLSALAFFSIYRLRQNNRYEKALAREQQQRFHDVLEAQEKERKRIAGDLHDSVGQLLSVVKMSFSDLEDSLHIPDNDQREQFRNALNYLDEASNEVRAVSHNLMPSALMRSGIVSAVRELVTRVNKAGTVEIGLELDDFPDRLNENAEINLYRIIQELTNNMIRHSGATMAVIRMYKQAGRLQVRVTDNGKGLDKKRLGDSPGIGWKNIYSRAGVLGADIDIRQPEKGSEVVIRFGDRG